AWRGGSALAVVLNPGGSQPGKAMLVDGRLPVKELVDAQRIAVASLFEAQQTAAYGSDDFGFAPDHPTPRIGGREIGDRQGAAVGPYHILDAGTHLHGHFTLILHLTCAQPRALRLKF